MTKENLQTDASAKVNSALSKLNSSRLNSSRLNSSRLNSSRLNDSRLNDAKRDASTVLNFDEENRVSTGKDINVKITALDSDLVQLRSELGSINSSVEEGLDRLGDSDTDLTAKVSETYKRLGEIDNAYKSLLEISSRIDVDLRKLNGDISDVAEQTATGIQSLEKSTVDQSNDLAQKNQQVASRVNHLAETSKLTSEIMVRDIQSTTEKMLQIERNIVTQIETLSSITKDKTTSITTAVDQNKAKILKLQSVDEAIIRRATTLEITTAELTAKGQYIDSSVEQLQLSSDSLTSAIDGLNRRTKLLEELAESQGSVISDLQKGSIDMVAKVVALSSRERNHFNSTLIALCLLLVATVFIYVSQQDQFDVNDLRYVEKTEALDKQHVAVSGSMAVIESKIKQITARLSDVQDHTASVEARINQLPLVDQIGNDNIIHGPQWIVGLSPDEFTVQLAYVENKDLIYEIAQSYNFYLKESLSYFVVNEDGVEKYILLSGSYATHQQAETVVRSLPSYIDMQQPVIREIGAVQKAIVES